MISHVDRLKNAHDYDDKAREICSNWDIPYEEQRKQVNALLAEYLEKQFKTKIRVY
jgi:hypothetical protein